jgi:hypothetical protein
MPRRDTDIVTLCECPTEGAAAHIAGVLRERGVPARHVGGLTAGLRAEAPGTVRVLVRRADLDRASMVLEQVRREAQAIDWSAVDLGRRDDDRDNGLGDEESQPEEESPER